VERITRMLAEDESAVNIDRLLVVTFTEAAAGEMRQRIGRALAERLRESPGNAQLQRQLLLLPRAYIGTIHSFCAEIIRNHFYLLNLDPGFRVMDENEMFMLRSEILEGVLDALYEEHENSPVEDPFIYLTRILAGGHGDDREISNTVLGLYDFARSLPRPEAWLQGLAQSLERAAGLSWEDQYWVEEWREMLRLEMDSWVENMEEARVLAASPGGPRKYVDLLTEECRKVEEWRTLVSGSFNDLRAAVEDGLNWPQLPRVNKGEADEQVKKKVQELRNGVKKRVNDFYRDFFSRSATELLEDFRIVAPLVQALVNVVLSFHAAYAKAKAERAVVDFSDLEHYALAILARNGEGSPWGQEQPADPEERLLPSPVAFNYQDHFYEVLVDEYQDINGIQEAILQLVSRNDNRFLVGDVKQSIYRFRLADPTVFLNCYREFKDLYEEGETVSGRRLDLSHNFRSCPALLEAVNYVFRLLMSKRVAEVDYDERARLNPGRKSSGVNENQEAVEFHLLEYADPQVDPAGTGDASGDEPEVEDLDLLRLEARWVAERIYKMVVTDRYRIYDRSTHQYRLCSWRDVVVLMRSPKGRVGVFMEEFRRLGIPVYAGGSGGYFAAPEVQIILSLLQVIDNPRRDIPLAAVLRSPVVGLNASQLANIRLADPENDFYTAVCRVAQGEKGTDPQLVKKLRDFLARLKEWRDLARGLPPAELLEEIYRRTGYSDTVGAVPGGAARQANLRALIDRARHFDGTVYRGLFRFLRFVEQVREKGGDLDAARSLGENEDVVRLMSIHKSKGLEFPVVFVAGLGRNFNLRDLGGNFLWHRRLGCGPVVTDLSKGVRYPTVLHKVIRHRLRLESMAEEMRLLYVAFTRAEEKLIVTGVHKNLDRAVDKWSGQAAALPAPGVLSSSLVGRAKGPLDWLGPALWASPSLAGVHYTGQLQEHGGDSWRLFLWPSSSLSHLWQNRDQETDPASGNWMDFLKKLEPLPEEWIRCQGKDCRMVDTGELRHRLFWSYPHTALAGLPSKITVTGWVHRLEEMEGEAAFSPAAPDVVYRPVAGDKESLPGFDLPVFYTGVRHDGAERGQVVHLVMEKLCLDGPLDRDDIYRQLDKMVYKKILSPEQRELVSAEKIANFFTGGLGKRVLEAASRGRLHREVPFTLGIDVTELHPNLAERVSEEETVLLQGIIDCLLMEQDGLVIIDYKTDRLAEGQLKERVNRYHRQLELYARAAATILGQPVKEQYLYFFELNRAVPLLPEK